MRSEKVSENKEDSSFEFKGVKDHRNKGNSYRRGLLISSSAGMFIWGVIATIAPLATSWPFISILPVRIKAVFLFIPSVFLLIGNNVMGVLSDRIGRKIIYMSTIILYVVGLIVVFFSYSLYPLILGIALSEMGVGGEEVTTLSLISEDMTAKERGKYLVLVPNMSNIGTAAIAFIFLYFYSSALSVQKTYFIFMALIAIVLAVFTRMAVPESYRWLSAKGKNYESEREMKKLDIRDDGVDIKQPNFYFSLVFLGIIGVSQYLTFGLMEYIIGPFYFSSSPVFVSEIIFYASLGAGIAGFIAIFMVEWGRKRLALFSFWGGTAVMVVILLFMKYIDDVYIFIPLLLLNMAFSEFAWATRTTLEPELFRTNYRSTAIGLVRVFPIIAYIISIYETSAFTLGQYLTFNVILWAVGGMASLVWYMKGVETRGINIDYKKSILKT